MNTSISPGDLKIDIITFYVGLTHGLIISVGAICACPPETEVDNDMIGVRSATDSVINTADDPSIFSKPSSSIISPLINFLLSVTFCMTWSNSPLSRPKSVSTLSI